MGLWFAFDFSFASLVFGSRFPLSLRVLFVAFALGFVVLTMLCCNVWIDWCDVWFVLGL